jgi:hypothetical protein
MAGAVVIGAGPGLISYPQAVDNVRTGGTPYLAAWSTKSAGNRGSVRPG